MPNWFRNNRPKLEQHLELIIMPMTPQSIKFCSLLLGLVVAATNARGDAPVNASAQIDAIIQLDLKKHKLQPNPPVSDI
ncbi:MAG TPA: hypothetical protein DCY79_10750, partial [Planctomycetaceae bacterium]|nr:hypothetical protein [Planctomycetaceae bacterium]